MNSSSSRREDKFLEASSSSSKTRQPRTVPDSRAASADANTSASVPPGLTRENTSSSAEQGSLSSSAAMFPSTGSTIVEATGSNLSAPVQKRRRITRACDECRRKKIKCDGKHPCLHCTVYSYECTYDQPSNRSRRPHPQYVESLEQRLQQAEAMLKSLVPGIELGDQSFTLRQQRPVTANTEDQQASSTNPSQSLAIVASGLPAECINVPAQGSDVEPSLGGTAHFEIDQHGRWHYYGYSSGLSLIKQIHKAFINVSLKNDNGQLQLFSKVSPSSSSAISLQRTSSKLFGPSFAVDSVTLDVEPSPPLLSLSREVIHRLCEIALQDACPLCPIIHEPTFMRRLNRILDLPKTNYQLQDQRFLALLYAVLAVGCIFAKDESLLANEEGNKYFKASQRLIDLTDCHDISSLQSLLYVIKYLQLSANVSACYFYIGVAVRSAYQQGLHRSILNAFVDNYEATSHLGAIENETRKRVFWAIFKIDVVVSTFLGLPICSHDTEIDQDYLVEVDDEDITENGIQKSDNGNASRPSAANAHSNLVIILKKINKWVYPINRTIISSASGDVDADRIITRSENSRMKKYMARNEKVKEIERDLQNWSDTLPSGLRPNGDAPPRILRNQQLLRFLFAQTQMALYRPLLHELLVMYDSSGKSKIDVFGEELSRYAGNCVSVARNIIHITSEARSQCLLQKDHWFAVYTTFFAFIITASSLLGGSASRADESLFDDLQLGKKALFDLSKQNIMANRCHAILDSKFENLLDLLRGRSKILKKYKERKLTLSYEALSVEKTSQVPTDTITSSLSGFNSELLPNIDSATIKQASQQQLYAEKCVLEHKQQHNLYQGRSDRYIPTSSSFSHNQATRAMSSELTGQASSSHDAISSPQIPNLDNDALLSFMPSTAVPSNPNPQLPFADISDLLFTPADPFAYPFSPFTVSSADATAGASTEQTRDVEMADYFKVNPPATSQSDIHAVEEAKNYGIEYNQSGIDYVWDQGGAVNPVPISTSVSVPAPTSIETSAYVNFAGAGSSEQPLQLQQVQQRQQQSQSQPQQRGYRNDHGQMEEQERIPDQGRLGNKPMERAQTQMASGSVSSSEEDESNDDDADDDDDDDDDNETDSDDDDDNDNEDDNSDDNEDDNSDG